MKKFVFCILSTLLVLSLVVGCSSSKPSNSSTNGQNNESGKKLTIGVTIANRDLFLTTYENYLTEAAKAYDNVEVVGFDAQMDVQKQYDHLNTFVTKKYDAIVLSAVNTDTIPEMLNMVGDIPVVIAHRMPANVNIEDILRDGKDAYVGSDNLVAGQLQADFLADYFNKKGKKEINYAMLIGDLGAEVSVVRTEGVLKGLENKGFKLNKVLEDTANWDRAKAMSMIQTLLGTSKTIDTIIANNDEMALGAIEAINITGKAAGIPVVGIDATDAALESIKNGGMAMTVFANAKAQAEKTIEVAINSATGKPFDPVNWVPYEAVTKENVDNYIKK